MLSHLGEDPYIDDKKLIYDFMDGYYGPASPALTKYLELAVEACENSPIRMRCVENFCKADFVTYDLVPEGAGSLTRQRRRSSTMRPIRRVRQGGASLDVTILLRYDSLLYVANKRGAPASKPSGCGAALRADHQETILQTEPYRMEHNIPQHPYWEGGVPMLWQTTPYTPSPMECFAGKGCPTGSSVRLCDPGSLKLGMCTSMTDSVTGFAAAASWIQMPEFARASIWSAGGRAGRHLCLQPAAQRRKFCTPGVS